MIDVPIIAVLGRWPKSGTTLLMQVLDAVGARAIRDLEGSYAIDWASYSVLYHPEKILLSYSELRSAKLWETQVIQLVKSGIKIQAAITPWRSFDESIKSWENSSAGYGLPSENRLIEMWQHAIGLLRKQGVPCYEIDFHDLIDNPLLECARIADMLGGAWNIQEMVKIPDKSKRHYGMGV